MISPLIPNLAAWVVHMKSARPAVWERVKSQSPVDALKDLYGDVFGGLSADEAFAKAMGIEAGGQR